MLLGLISSSATWWRFSLITTITAGFVDRLGSMAARSRNKRRGRGVVDIMITATKASKEQLRARLELRRSSAASKHKNLKKYNRKNKDWKGEDR